MFSLATKTLKSKGCVHHYMLPEPSGENEVIGVCKKCGDERAHELTLPWKVWNSWRGDQKKSKQTKAMTPGEEIKNRNRIKREKTAQKGKDDKHK